MISSRDVLDKGYVRLVTWMPWNMVKLYEAVTKDNVYEMDEYIGKDDLIGVNAARASFLKESGDFSDGDRRLLKYLARNHEYSPFRHSVVTFEVHAPLMVARQWFKYRVGSIHSPDMGQDQVSQDFLQAWNESSRRYITEEPEFYVPSEWRSAPDNKKQGSGGNLDEKGNRYALSMLEDIIDTCVGAYNTAIEMGIAPEQARLFLPAYGMYITWRWTASLDAIGHFLRERLAGNAQHEIREYAEQVKILVEQIYPESLSVLLGEEKENA